MYGPFLKRATDALETAAGGVTSANPNEPGYWQRIRIAAEILGGATSVANASIYGDMLRTAVALERLSATTGAEENATFDGYLKRIVDALEVKAGHVNAGSLEYRFALGAEQAIFTISYDAAASALFARMSPAPSDTRKGIINTLILALKAAGTWTLFDVLYVFAADAEANALLEWKGNTLYNGVKTGVPTFTTDRGFTATTGLDIITTGYLPATLSLGMTQNSAHFGGYTTTDSTTVAGDVYFGSGVTNRIVARSIQPTAGLNATGPGIANSPTGTSPHHIVGSRTGAALFAAYRNGVAGSNNATASSSIGNNGNFILLGTGASNSDRRLAIAHCGQGWTTQQTFDTYTAFFNYLTAIGSPA